MKALFLISILFWVLPVDANQKCDKPRGEHHLHLKLSLKAPGKDPSIEAWNRVSIKEGQKFCKKKGFQFLHSYLHEAHGQSQVLTQVLCSNESPRNPHFNGEKAQGEDYVAQIHHAHFRLLEELKNRKEKFTKENPGKPLPSDWETPEHKMNVLVEMGVKGYLGQEVVNSKFCEKLYTRIDKGQ